MAQSEPQRFRLRAPDGTVVTVRGETRRDTLLSRGYQDADQAPADKPDDAASDTTSDAERAQSSAQRPGDRRPAARR